MTKKNTITVFEHESLRLSDDKLSKGQLESLQAFYGEKGVPYYSLIHKGVKFNSFVGVLQVGPTTIEVLPKADGIDGEDAWRKTLIDMMRSVGLFDIHAPSQSRLSLKTNSILDLYFELFIKHVEYLLHSGLVKKYRKVEGNKTVLKGRLMFGKHMTKNAVHKERFYVCHTTYDNQHQLHCILYKAIHLLKRINSNALLSNRLGSLILDFPEMPDIKITESLFSKLNYNRKTEKYRNAIEIARLLLLNYHPDVRSGQNDVLALMFNMNLLWEKFVYSSLRKHKSSDTEIKSQTKKGFWKPDNGNRSSIKPDIVIHPNNERCVVLDTKWKNLNGKNPSPDDLRQMYVYMKYYNAKKVALVYPGGVNTPISGKYFKESSSDIGENECSIISLAVNQDITKWQQVIHETVSDWL